MTAHTARVAAVALQGRRVHWKRMSALGEGGEEKGVSMVEAAANKKEKEKKGEVFLTKQI